MDEKRRTRISKLMSFALRHEPEELGIELDDAGWTDVDALLAAMEPRLGTVSRAELLEVVASSPKQRFALRDDNTRVRASQGHSVGVELGLVATAPPERLFHGTHPRALESIGATGLERRGRDHVHLSSDRETAAKVGSRRGRAVILVVAAGDMARAGHSFFLSDNGVWLTEHVPARFLTFP